MEGWRGLEFVFYAKRVCASPGYPFHNEQRS